MGVVVPPDCTSEYNNASALPGERNITLLTARLCPEKQLEKQSVSLGDGMRGPKVIAMHYAIIRAWRHAEGGAAVTLLHSLLTKSAARPNSDVEVYKNNQRQLVS